MKARWAGNDQPLLLRWRNFSECVRSLEGPFPRVSGRRSAFEGQKDSLWVALLRAISGRVALDFLSLASAIATV